VTVLVLSQPILTLNAVIKPGTTWTLLVTVADATNNPITNPTGWGVRTQIRATPTSAVLFEWNRTPTTGQGQATFTGSVVTLALVPSDSASWSWAAGTWDCLLTDPSGVVTCLFEGTVTLDPLVTHS
jgi:hypothetical protein